jgi:hypothetical protein
VLILCRRDDDRPKLSYENQKLAQSLFGKKKKSSKKGRKRSLKGRKSSIKEEQKPITESSQNQEIPTDSLLVDPFGISTVQPTQQEEKKDNVQVQPQIQLDQLIPDTSQQKEKEVPMSKLVSLDELFGNVSISEKEKQPVIQAESSSMFLENLEPIQPIQPSKQQPIDFSTVISPTTQTVTSKVCKSL